MGVLDECVDHRLGVFALNSDQHHVSSMAVGRKNRIGVAKQPVPGELVFTLLPVDGIGLQSLPAFVEQTHERILDCGLLGKPLSTVGVLGDSVISCYCKLLKVPTSVVLSY